MPYVVAYATYAGERLAPSARARSTLITLILTNGHCLRRRLLHAGRLQSRELLIISSSSLPLRLPGRAIPLRAPRHLLLLRCAPCTSSCHGVDLPGSRYMPSPFPPRPACIDGGHAKGPPRHTR